MSRGALSQARRPAGGARRLVRGIGSRFATLSGSLCARLASPSAYRGRWRHRGLRRVAATSRRPCPCLCASGIRAMCSPRERERSSGVPLCAPNQGEPRSDSHARRSFQAASRVPRRGRLVPRGSDGAAPQRLLRRAHLDHGQRFVTPPFRSPSLDAYRRGDSRTRWRPYGSGVFRVRGSGPRVSTTSSAARGWPQVAGAR